MKPIDRAYAGSDAETTLLGSRLHPLFTVISELSGDARGKLYRAKSVADGRKVAIKALTGETPITKALLKAPHVKNTLRILDVMPAGKESFIVLEQPQGTALSKLLSRQGRMPVSLALSVTLEILEILKALHAEDRLHGSVNPGSVFVSRSVRGKASIKMVYLGLRNESALRNDSGYLPPELAETKGPLSPQIDLWAAAVLLYRMLFRVHPFIGRTQQETLGRLLLDEPVILEEFSKKHPDLTAFMMRALERSPKMRYSSAEAMAEALAEIAQPPQDTRPRASTASSSPDERRVSGMTPSPTDSASELEKGVPTPATVSPREAPESELRASDPDFTASRVTPPLPAGEEGAVGSPPELRRLWTALVLAVGMGSLLFILWWLLGNVG